MPNKGCVTGGQYRRTVAAAVLYNSSSVPPTSGQCDWLENSAQIGKVRQGVTPWLALGGGGGAMHSPALQCTDMQPSSSSHYPPRGCPSLQLVDPFGFWHNDYDRRLSWQLGSEINNLSRYDRLDAHGKIVGGVPASARFAPWNYSQRVTLYPSPFDSRFLPENGSNTGMRHFASYVRGAAGIAGYPCATGICMGNPPGLRTGGGGTPGAVLASRKKL